MARRAVLSGAFAVIALTAATPSASELKLNKYDALGRLDRACQLNSNASQKTTYYMDVADNRATYDLHVTTQLLPQGSQRWSPDGQFVLQMQSDGNLVVYQKINVNQYTPTWSSQTDGKGATTAVLQADGNLVLYKPDGTLVWATNTSSLNNVCAELYMGNNGYAVILDLFDNILWQSTTPGH